MRSYLKETGYMLDQQHVGSPNSSTNLTLQQAVDLVTRRHWSGTKSEVKTVNCAKHAVAVLGAERPIREINEAVLDEFIVKLQQAGNSPATINRKLSAIQKCIRWAHRRGYVDRMPVFERLREPQGRVRWLSQDEERRLFEHASRLEIPNDVQALWQFLLYTGLRLSEAIRLEWEDVDAVNRRVHLWETKANYPRTVPLSQKAVDALKKVRRYEDGPFTHLYQMKINRAWRQVRKAMGLEDDGDFVVHSLRHSFCSRLVQKGVDLYRVQKLAGHKNVDTTQRYAHLRQEDLAEAVEALD